MDTHDDYGMSISKRLNDFTDSEAFLADAEKGDWVHNRFDELMEKNK